ncbi:MAG: NAD(P)-dependent oxidoreductase [Pseudomonadota bacterium]
MRALVTGASGFVGRHLVKSLLNEGHGVIALLRPQSCTTFQNENFQRIDIDDWSEDALKHKLEEKDFDAVIHLAASGVDPSDRALQTLHEINTKLPATLVSLAALRKAVMIGAGSSAEYHTPSAETPLKENDRLEDEASYGTSKAQGGAEAIEAAVTQNVPMRHLRFFHIYGAGEAPHRLLPTLIHHAKTTERIALSEGSQQRDFLYVGDAVSAIITACHALLSKKASGGRAVNVCTGQATTVRAFTLTATRLLNIDTARLGFGDLPLRPQENSYVVGDPAEIGFDLGWRAAYDLEAGLQAALKDSI